ncbi:hypothetical protein N7532_005057 [Penicillium argentinense]|uniref:Uncharacterized protein n=1 Tax=Penicillium argentinense TaxID=1131581 RepID=A0A9W9K9Z9_9EURO|nr:uncharacterized protein N7532_005057 [Penicillium argentinense]KAJ5098056.1 hypothetical protein N7532_005057 [Penicillium argentinense]
MYSPGMWLLALIPVISVMFLSIAEAAWPVQSFKSSPFHPPVLEVSKTGQTEPGYIFGGPADIKSDTRPTIVADDGQLIWKGGLGQFPSKFCHVFDTGLSYLDLHEAVITPHGSVLVTAFNTTRGDLSVLGGSADGRLLDSLFYEIDIASKEILFRWSVLEHLDRTNSYIPLAAKGDSQESPWDFAHLNSVQMDGDRYIVTVHGFCSEYIIDRNGRAGTVGDFTLGPGAQFCWQHDARIESRTENTITLRMHNNDNAPWASGTAVTTGLLLDVDLDTKAVSVRRRIWDSQNAIYSPSQGSYQSPRNGHVLLGHGTIPQLEEYDEHGQVVMRARFGQDGVMMSYPMFRSPWIGRPRT